MAKKTIIITKKIFCWSNTSEKKARSGFTSGFKDADINPQKPIKKTIMNILIIKIIWELKILISVILN